MSDQLSGGEARALRQLVDEARAEPPPELDWNRVERELMAKVALEQRSRERARAGRRSAWGPMTAFALAAAAMALLLASQEGREPSAVPAVKMVEVDPTLLPAEQQEGALPTYQVRGMPPRSVVMSGEEPMRFSLEGVANWVLAPHSRVVVQTNQAPHVLVLEEGTVHAEVVPRNDSDQLIESFVVETGNARVAVHGTVLSVTRGAGDLTVEVMRGNVTVGPAGHRGVTTGHLLIGPARATFTLSGRLLSSGRPSPAAAGQAAAGSPADTAPSQAAVDAPDAEPAAMGEVRAPEAPAPPPGSEPEASAEPEADEAPARLTRGEARRLVESCLSDSADSGDATGGTRLTISSQVTAVVDQAGKVMAVRFSPPLRPDLQQRCGGALFGRAVEGDRNITFPVAVAP